MMTSNAILGYLNFIVEKTLSQFPIEKFYVYDESLDFSERAIQYITRTGPYEKIEGEVPSTWVILIWSRGSLEKSEMNGRLMVASRADPQDLSRLSGESNFRLVDLQINCKLVTNSIEMAEDIEEFLFVLSEEYVSFDFSDEQFGEFSGSSKGSSTEFEKETTDGYGSVSSVTLNATITYPVILPAIERKDIRVINDNVIPTLFYGEVK